MGPTKGPLFKFDFPSANLGSRIFWGGWVSEPKDRPPPPLKNKVWSLPLPFSLLLQYSTPAPPPPPPGPQHPRAPAGLCGQAIQSQSHRASSSPTRVRDQWPPSEAASGGGLPQLTNCHAQPVHAQARYPPPPPTPAPAPPAQPLWQSKPPLTPLPPTRSAAAATNLVWWQRMASCCPKAMRTRCAPPAPLGRALQTVGPQRRPVPNLGKVVVLCESPPLPPPQTATLQVPQTPKAVWVVVQCPEPTTNRSTARLIPGGQQL